MDRLISQESDNEEGDGEDKDSSSDSASSDSSDDGIFLSDSSIVLVPCVSCRFSLPSPHFLQKPRARLPPRSALTRQRRAPTPRWKAQIPSTS